MLEHAVSRSLAVHGEAVELARQTDGEVTDVDHLLDLALTFGANLAHLQSDQGAEVALVLAQGVAQLADEVATDRGGGGPPRLKGLLRGGDHLLIFVRRRLSDRGDDFAVDG